MEKEQRIRAITSMYYSRPEIQEAIFSFSQNREVVPRYFEGFGKRPDALQYKRDIFELAKKGATSFHCSEELWENPLGISTNMNEKQFNESRTGWDLLIDIDSKYIDYSKILAKLIIKILKFHGVKNLGIKFSGSKGFHIIIPWNSFPKEINKVRTSDMFPEWPRIISKYIAEKTKEELTKKINELSYENLDYGSVKKYIRREGGSEEIRQVAGDLWRFAAGEYPTSGNRLDRGASGCTRRSGSQASVGRESREDHAGILTDVVRPGDSSDGIKPGG